MSDVPQGPGWWQASDDRWYPPESHPDLTRGGAAPAPGGGFQGPTPGPYGQAPYGQGAYGVPYNAAPGNEQLAIISLVLGIASIPLFCCCYIGLFTGVGAIVTGFMARRKIDESHGMLEGDGMALAGIVLGAVAVVLTIVLIVANVFFNVATYDTPLR